MIPFSWWPGSWGLKGKTREIAKAEYELEGYELEKRLAEINATDSQALKQNYLDIDLKYNKISDYEHKLKSLQLNFDIQSSEYQAHKLEVDFENKLIDEYTFDYGVASLTEPAVQKNLNLIGVELKHNRITVQEYERRKADILEEPWIAMPKISWDPENGVKTYFELDYNDHFVGFLRDNGYQGTDEDCINKWLGDICYSVLDEMNQPEPELITPIKKIRLPDGKTEHS